MSRATSTPSGSHEGTTANAAVCRALLASLIERGLPTDRAVLFVIDGGKAIRKAIRDAYGALAPVHRCRLHYADLRIMPTRRGKTLAAAVNALARSA